MSASIVQLYRLEEVADPVTIPTPPLPLSTPRNRRCSNRRRLVHGLGLTAACALLASLLLLIHWVSA